MDGRKMSKSIGNTILPQEVIQESGAEILRLWVAMTDYREELRVSKEILARVVEAYRKLRNTCRILVANLYDFDPAVDSVPIAQLDPVDRFALARYAETAQRILAAYDEYAFSSVSQQLNTLATVDLSAFYVDVTKDRLYTLAPGSASRRAAQTAMYILADGLARLTAPLLPVTAEQLWKVLPGDREPSVHLAEFPSPATLQSLTAGVPLAEWDRLLAIRAEVNAAIEWQRKGKVIGTPLMAAVLVEASGADLALLRAHTERLPTLFIVSKVDIAEAPAGVLRVSVSRADGVKCQRCWRIVSSVSSDAGREGLCDRCVDALAAPVAR
jgi:isoleucyl-tRNA synthetase